MYFREPPSWANKQGVEVTELPHYCVAYGCKNTQGNCKYGFHHFPSEKKRREAWAAAIR